MKEKANAQELTTEHRESVQNGEYQEDECEGERYEVEKILDVKHQSRTVSA
jgi:hypothetical protein